jgi:hypothetical protein
MGGSDAVYASSTGLRRISSKLAVDVRLSGLSAAATMQSLDHRSHLGDDMVEALACYGRDRAGWWRRARFLQWITKRNLFDDGETGQVHNR